MPRRIIFYQECIFCYCTVQHQFQGHRCPDPESGDARQEPTQEFLEFLTSLDDPEVLLCLIEELPFSMNRYDI